MKLRIRGNSIRLRLTQTEVQDFGSSGAIESTVQFGPGNDPFRYEMTVGTNGHSGAKFDGNCLTVIVPFGDAKRWTSSDQVSLEYQQPINERENLSILVEKDFACLTERPNGDDSDAFPNPNESC